MARMHLRACVLMFICVCVCVCAGGDTGRGNVVVLDHRNFEKMVYGGEEDWLVEFYAPWCVFCERLEDTYKHVAHALQDHCRVGKVDCTSNQDICDRFEVTAYPTIKMVKGSQMHHYQGESVLDDIVSFARSITDTGGESLPEFSNATSSLPIIVPLSITNFTSYTHNRDTDLRGVGWFVEFYSPECVRSKRFLPIYQRYAHKAAQEGVLCGAVDCIVEEDLCMEYNVSSLPHLIFVRNDTFWVYNEERTLSGLREFARGILNSGDIHKNSTSSPKLYGEYHQFVLLSKAFIQALKVFVMEHVWESLAGTFLYGVFLGWIIFSSSTPPADAYIQTEIVPDKSGSMDKKGDKSQQQVGGRRHDSSEDISVDTRKAHASPAKREGDGGARRRK